MSFAYLPTFVIPRELAARVQQEPGFAVLLHVDGVVADFAFVRDLVPEFDGDGKGDGNWGKAVQALDDARCVDTLRRFLDRGQVHVGILTSHDFIPLRRLQGATPA
jgi:hypothetical protein